jgi:hypothetical protein
VKKTRKSAKPISADAIARLADRGKDVSHFFKGGGRMVQPIQRVNADVTASMLEELDKAAQDLNVSRQAVIKTLSARLSINTTWHNAPGDLSPRPKRRWCKSARNVVQRPVESARGSPFPASCRSREKPLNRADFEASPALRRYAKDRKSWTTRQSQHGGTPTLTRSKRTSTATGKAGPRMNGWTRLTK